MLSRKEYDQDVVALEAMGLEGYLWVRREAWAIVSKKIYRKHARLAEYRQVIRNLAEEVRELRVIEGRYNDKCKEEWDRMMSDDLLDLGS